MHQLKAIVIGSGIAGIATAIRLRMQGYQVSVYEKNETPGGKLSEYQLDGFHFDAGPSLFTQPALIEELFELAGEPISKYIRWEPVDIACTYFYENGNTVHAYTDPEKFGAELEQKVNEPAFAVKKYLQDAANLYDLTGTIFLNNSLHKRRTWLQSKIKRALSAVRYSHLFHSLDDFNKKRFRSPEAIQLFNRFATYNGSDPFQAPAMLSLVSSIEHKGGTFYPEGGMISIARALYNLAIDKGVIFHFNKPVDRIIHHEEKVRGVVAGGENITADVVVSNADVYFTWKYLLANNVVPAKILKQERSSSAVIFYWGINKVFDQLQLHNIFFSKDYKKEFDHIFKRHTLSDDPTIYINITSKMETSKSPEGKENWFVMVNAPSNTGQNWEQLKLTLRNNVLIKLSRMLGEDIESLIETEQVGDPVSIETQTGSYRGSLYGTSSNSKFAAFMRHANFTDTIKGLYFCGGTVHPGGGIPLCLKSAQIVSDLVKRQHH